MIRNSLMLGGLAAIIALAASRATTQEAARPTPAATPSQRHTVWDSVYTAAQARRGERVVGQVCSACHAQPADSWGSAFMSGWNGRTVAELVEELSSTMPKDSPGGLTRAEYVDVITYMLKLNGAPAGETELATTDEALRAVRIRFPRP